MPVADRVPVVRAVLVAAIGAILLGASMRITETDWRFAGLTVALAATWAAGGWWVERAIAPLRRSSPMDRSMLPITAWWTLAVAAAFFVGGLIAARLPLLGPQVAALTERAVNGPLLLVLLLAAITGVAEELFFRGALFSLLPSGRAVIGSTLIYAIVTAASANLGLIAAAVVLGLAAAMVRRKTGSVGPAIGVHLGWTLVMIGVFPLVQG